MWWLNRTVFTTFHSFCGSGICKWLIWGSWLRVSHAVAVRCQRGLHHLKPFRGCWQVGSRNSSEREGCPALGQTYSGTGAAGNGRVLNAGSFVEHLPGGVLNVVFSSNRCNPRPLASSAHICAASLCPFRLLSWAVSLSRWLEVDTPMAHIWPVGNFAFSPVPSLRVKGKGTCHSSPIAFYQDIRHYLYLFNLSTVIGWRWVFRDSDHGFPVL